MPRVAFGAVSTIARLVGGRDREIFYAEGPARGTAACVLSSCRGRGGSFPQASPSVHGKTMTGKERRKSVRAPLDVPGALRVDGRWVTCALKDISTTGVALRTELKQTDGSAASVVFMLPGSNLSIELEGVLVRRRGVESQSEWAVQYFPPPAEFAEEIQRYIDAKTGAAAPAAASSRTRAQQKALEEALERRRLAAEVRRRKEARGEETRSVSEKSPELDDLFRNALDDLGKG